MLSARRERQLSAESTICKVVGSGDMPEDLCRMRMGKSRPSSQAQHQIRAEWKGRGTNPPFAHAAIAGAESSRPCGRVLVAMQRISRLRSFIGVNFG